MLKRGTYHVHQIMVCSRKRQGSSHIGAVPTGDQQRPIDIMDIFLHPPKGLTLSASTTVYNVDLYIYANQLL